MQGKAHDNGPVMFQGRHSWVHLYEFQISFAAPSAFSRLMKTQARLCAFTREQKGNLRIVTVATHFCGVQNEQAPSRCDVDCVEAGGHAQTVEHHVPWQGQAVVAEGVVHRHTACSLDARQLAQQTRRGFGSQRLLQ